MEKIFGINKWTSILIPSSEVLNKTYYPPKIIYKSNKTLETIDEDPYNKIPKIQDIRKAAEIHRQTRRYIQERLKPNMKIMDICKLVENKNKELAGNKESLEIGNGFPCTISINNVAAHDTAKINDNRIIKKSDIVKIDFGTHKNGYIIDSAFSFSFDNKFIPLFECAKDSVFTGIKLSGLDVLISEIAEGIKEVTESYEIELDNKIYNLKPTKVLCGHSLDQYTIHAGQLIPSINNPDINKNQRMTNNTFYAIETFPSTSDGEMYIDENSGCDLYALKMNNETKKFNFKITNQVYNYIKNYRGKLPFCTRWIEENVGKACNIGINELMKKDMLIGYPPIISKNGTYSSQYEHTIYIGDEYKEILSYGDDY